MVAFRKPQLDLAHAAGRAFGQLKEGLFETDLDYRLVLINDFGARLAGFENAASCLEHGLNVAELFVDSADLKTILARLQAHDVLEGYVCKLFDRHKLEKWIEATVNVLHDDSGTRVGYWGVFRDLTPRREAEQAQQRMHTELLEALERLERSEQLVRHKNEQLEARNHQLRDFSAAVTHDLRAPLSAMKGFAEMLTELCSGLLDERGRHLLERIRVNCDQMDRIIRGLQELVLLAEEGEPRARVEPGQAMAIVVDNRRAEIERLGVRIEIQPDLPALQLHPTKLYQLLDNLVSNAIKHLAGVAEPRIWLGWRAGPDGPVLFVQDNGSGVQPAHRERIFEMFYRCDRSLPGAGLGLSIAQRVVDLYAGKIWIEAVEQGGARFCFNLPGARFEGNAAPADPPNASP